MNEMSMEKRAAYGEPMKLSWNHTVCERCWFGAEPLRFPVQVNREPGDRTVDVCCLCGTVKLTRIFLRWDPKDPVLLCGGIDHDGDE